MRCAFVKGQGLNLSSFLDAVRRVVAGRLPLSAAPSSVSFLQRSTSSQLIVVFVVLFRWGLLAVLFAVYFIVIFSAVVLFLVVVPLRPATCASSSSSSPYLFLQRALCVLSLLLVLCVLVFVVRVAVLVVVVRSSGRHMARFQKLLESSDLTPQFALSKGASAGATVLRPWLSLSS